MSRVVDNKNKPIIVKINPWKFMAMQAVVLFVGVAPLFHEHQGRYASFQYIMKPEFRPILIIFLILINAQNILTLVQSWRVYLGKAHVEIFPDYFKVYYPLRPPRIFHKSSISIQSDSKRNVVVVRDENSKRFVFRTKGFMKPFNQVNKFRNAIESQEEAFELKT